MKQVDFLVIGSGLAGLTFALKVAEAEPDKQVMVITKAVENEANSHYAQGGVAAVTNFRLDSFEKHIEDTLIAGSYLCDPQVVELVVKEGAQRVQDLIKLGVPFDKTQEGELDLGLEGGHSAPRILHFKDTTGAAILSVLLEKAKHQPNIEILTHLFALDLLVSGDHDKVCQGAYTLDTASKSLLTIQASVTVLATGGSCQVYSSTTNPLVATGDGVAMAYRAGADVRDMEFIQFHPTSLYNPGKSPAFLITEALRGAGAVLRNARYQKEFMYDYDERGPLAPRDVVARSIHHEMKKHGDDFVYIDARHLGDQKLKDHFPNIVRTCKQLGYDLTTDLLPVVPAAHYFCGGIHADTQGRTSIANLYACGECAHTGLHGANRLASNSLLEALVFGYRAAEDSLEQFDRITSQTGRLADVTQAASTPVEAQWVADQTGILKSIMGKYAGIVRNENELLQAQKQLLAISSKTEAVYVRSYPTQSLCELRNLLTVAQLIIRDALQRKESVGLHYME
ncbi:L-aspartate oxidase [Rapidithrix thailandica]|uniref:L-aspartate oxidase n=1 Tax=Rapidithrix thailandica TaxID=413964 RepID=A0AAW9S8W5_9BACT